MHVPGNVLVADLMTKMISKDSLFLFLRDMMYSYSDPFDEDDMEDYDEVCDLMMEVGHLLCDREMLALIKSITE